jgi:plasmid stabilization system protein ParE
MTYSVSFDRKSRAELRSLIRYITKKNSARIAEGYAQDIVTFSEELHTFPHRGTARPDLAAGVRTMGFKGRITVAFRVSDELRTVTIVGIFYGGRSVEKAFVRGR